MIWLQTTNIEHAARKVRFRKMISDDLLLFNSSYKNINLDKTQNIQQLMAPRSHTSW
jgi:hypothetical protein